MLVMASIRGNEVVERTHSEMHSGVMTGSNFDVYISSM